jgi:hypothetical protein
MEQISPQLDQRHVMSTIIASMLRGQMVLVSTMLANEALTARKKSDKRIMVTS